MGQMLKLYIGNLNQITYFTPKVGKPGNLDAKVLDRSFIFEIHFKSKSINMHFYPSATLAEGYCCPLDVCPSVCLSVRPSVRLSVCLSVRLSVHT